MEYVLCAIFARIYNDQVNQGSLSCCVPRSGHTACVHLSAHSFACDSLLFTLACVRVAGRVLNIEYYGRERSFEPAENAGGTKRKRMSRHRSRYSASISETFRNLSRESMVFTCGFSTFRLSQFLILNIVVCFVITSLGETSFHEASRHRCTIFIRDEFKPFK